VIPRIFRFLFFIYAILLLIPAFLVFFIMYYLVFTFVPAHRAPHVAHRLVSRTGATVLFLLFFIRVKIGRREMIDPSRAYVFASNHQSQLDIPAFALSCRNTFRFLAKAELMRVPVLGYVIRKLYISVNRSDKKDRSRSMDAMMASLREGISVFICVEGTRNRTDKPLLEFKDGAFRLAIESGLPLAVFTVIDSRRLLNPNRPFELSPGVLHAEWSAVIETNGMTTDDIPRLKALARDAMLTSLGYPRPE
jgi:1-acyl-sn-glycerol-3-phosphate acyltransferase